MFRFLHPLVGAGGEGACRAYVHAAIVVHVSQVTQALLIRIAKGHTFAPDTFEVDLVLWEAGYVVLEVDGQVVALLLRGGYPT